MNLVTAPTMSAMPKVGRVTLKNQYAPGPKNGSFLSAFDHSDS